MVTRFAWKYVASDMNMTIQLSFDVFRMTYDICPFPLCFGI